MNRTRLLAIFLVGLTGLVSAQEFAPAFSRYAFLPAAGSTFQNGLLGFANPANVGMVRHFNARYYWAANGADNVDVDRWGFYSAVPGLGFGMQRDESLGREVTDYNVSLGGGTAGSSFGIGYTWSRGAEALYNRQSLWTVGLVQRPIRQLSFGAVGYFSSDSDDMEGLFELGLRPFPTDRVTLFGDVAIQSKQRLDEAPWSVGAAVEVIPGIHLNGRWFDSEAFTAGITFTLGNGFGSGQSHYDADQNRAFNTYSIGAGDYRPNAVDRFLFNDKGYAAMELKGRVDYRGYRFFDDNTLRLMDLLRQIEAAGDDPRISVVALNLSGLRVLPQHAWELREELRRLQAKDKKVVVFIDNVEMTGYHLASVADMIMLDPVGTVYMPGYVFGRTYLKGTLEKLGIGFDEWRFFKYKSAAEVLSRESLSDPDREQRQALADDFYELISNDVRTGRGLSREEFDALINDEAFFLPEQAVAAGLVDTLARWHEVDGVIEALTGDGKMKMPMEMVTAQADRYQGWGMRPQVAVVYALGECAMDSGIRARHLEKVLRRLGDNRHVKAVVLRVDSPGGDAMASDYVAEALRAVQEKKPVVVSQGQVAGSGGYWISMYGDTILAGPNTITGSIGVIGGWLWDKSFSGKLGMTSDHVQVGEHADLGYGVRMPLLGLQLPARNLNEDERARMETAIRSMYASFVSKVAQGRNMSTESVEVVAQGRVFSGWDGKEAGLVDGIGGMMDAVKLAASMAEIPDDGRMEVVEIGKYRGLFDSPFNDIPGVEAIDSDPTVRFLRFMSERNGQPVPMVLPGDYPTLD